MKRSTLARRSPLRQRSPLKRSRGRVTLEPGRGEWKEPRWGPCAVCGAVGPIVRHHIVYEQHIRRAGHPELAWDLRNALDVGVTCSCHHSHHWASRRIPLALITESAREFALEVLGSDRAAAWWERYYQNEDKDGNG